MLSYFDKRVPEIVNLGFREEAIVPLKAFLQMLWETNEQLNLVSRKMTAEELIDNHVIDCLLPLNFFPKKVKAVADFGTGGGLPGIIYALQFPDIKFRFYEKSHLKQDFLNRCKTLTKNIKIEGDIPLQLHDVDLVMARGFKPLDVLLDMSRDFYLKKGQYFLLKARREKIDTEIILAKKKFKDLNCQIQILQSPVLEVERHLVQIHF